MVFWPYGTWREAAGRTQERKRRKNFFFEKKEAKNFYVLVRPWPACTQGTKVFWFFFSKKNVLACLQSAALLQPG
jgi:hypothetical protein